MICQQRGWSLYLSQELKVGANCLHIWCRNLNFGFKGWDKSSGEQFEIFRTSKVLSSCCISVRSYVDLVPLFNVASLTDMLESRLAQHTGTSSMKSLFLLRAQTFPMKELSDGSSSVPVGCARVLAHMLELWLSTAVDTSCVQSVCSSLCTFVV